MFDAYDLLQGIFVSKHCEYISVSFELSWGEKKSIAAFDDDGSHYLITPFEDLTQRAESEAI